MRLKTLTGGFTNGLIREVMLRARRRLPAVAA